MFWFFLSVFLIIDAFLFYNGYDTVLWNHKTELEKKVQLKKFGFIKEENEEK